MTFRHVKFEDSPTMRALEKVARERGLVKQEPMQKIAQQQTSGQIVPGPAFLNRELLKGLGYVVSDVRNAYEIVKTAGGLTDILLNWIANRVHFVEDTVKKGAAITTNDIDSATDAVNALKRTLHPNMLHNYLPEILNKGVSQDVVWKQIEPMLDRALQNLGIAKNNLTQATLQSHSSLQPSDNFMENILKLCSGLRTRGLVKEAYEVETKFLNFKQAQTLYEVSKEKGEDQIHAAHPDGSHKLENVDSTLAVFYDILDKHTQHLEMVKKNPTGKLADASSIIQAVKTVLGQGLTLEKYVKSLAGKAYFALDAIIKTANSEMTSFDDSHYRDRFAGYLTDPNRQSLESALDFVDSLSQKIEPSAFAKWEVFEPLASGVSVKTWSRLQPQFAQVRLWLKQAISALDEGKIPPQAVSQYHSAPTPTAQAPAQTANKTTVTNAIFQTSLQNVGHLITQFNSLKSNPKFANKELQDWFNDEVRALEKINDTYSTMHDAGGSLTPVEVGNMQKEIKDIEQDLQTFHQDYGV